MQRMPWAQRSCHTGKAGASPLRLVCMGGSKPGPLLQAAGCGSGNGCAAVCMLACVPPACGAPAVRMSLVTMLTSQHAHGEPGHSLPQTHALSSVPRQVYETGQLVHEEDGSASALAAVVAEPPADFSSALYEPGACVGGTGLLPGSEARTTLEMENSARWGCGSGWRCGGMSVAAGSAAGCHLLL